MIEQEPLSYEETPGSTRLNPNDELYFHKSDLPPADDRVSQMGGLAVGDVETTSFQRVEKQPKSPEVAQIGAAGLWLVAFRRDGYVSPRVFGKRKGGKSDFDLAA